MSSEINLTLIVLGLNAFVTIAISLIGWMGKQMWESINEGNGFGAEAHKEVIKRLEGLDDEVEENSTILGRVEEKVEGNKKKIITHNERINTLEDSHERQQS